MSDTEHVPLEPPERPARYRAPGYNWQQLIAGALAAISVLGATVTSYKTGSASESAASAERAEYVTKEGAEKFRILLLEMQATQQGNIERLNRLEKRIEALEAASRPR